MSCFGCLQQSRPHANSSVNADGREVVIDDLVLNPNRIDAKLESRIAEWQAAINEYQAFEDICREEIDEELLPILEELREHPSRFKDRKLHSANVIALAAKLQRVQELQRQLESDKRDDDSSSLGARIRYYICYPCLGPVAGGNSESDTAPLRDTVTASVNHSMSDKLSAKWALRLNEINPTQGTLQRSSANLRAGTPGAGPIEPIKFKPKWPDFLIDTYFDVIKINMYGRKMRRIIKLNQHYVINITTNMEISKFYAYREIRRVWLENGNTIVVVLKNGKQSVYMSHIAPHVLQQLTTRVQVRRSLDSAEFSGPAFNLGYSAAVTAGIIKSISEENTLDSEAVVALFANELKDRTVRSIRGDSGVASGSDGSTTGASPRASAKFRSVSTTTLPTLTEEEDNYSGSSGFSQSNPLHAAQNGKKRQEQEKGKNVLPVAPVFISPFANAIQNAQPTANSAESLGPGAGGSPPLSRTVTDNSEYTEASFHTADSAPTSAPGTPTGRPGGAATTAGTGAGSGAGIAAVSGTSPSPAPSAQAPPTAAPRLLSLSEGMPEFYVQSAVQTLIFDPNTSEGNTRKIFIDKFKSACIVSLAQNALASANGRGNMQSAAAANNSTNSISARKSGKVQGATLLEVRHFVDGMHEYILSNRGVALALLFEREKQRAIILSTPEGGEASVSVPAPGQGTASSSPPPPGPSTPGGRGITRGNSKRGLLRAGADKASGDARTFQSPTSTAVVESELTSRASLQFLKDNNLDLSMIEEKVVVFISFVIFMVVEEAVFLPLKADLINLLPSSSKPEEEQLLLEKMTALSGRSQQQWGIPDDLVSPLGWQTAVFELQGLEHNLTPSTQLHVLIRTVKAVYNEFKHVILPQLAKRGASQSCIAADDLVPIFIYIFCRSNLKHPMRSRDLMWSLCHPDQLQGEGGYYLTVFESAIEFVLNEEVGRESFVSPYRGSATYTAADEASKQYVSGMRASLNLGKGGGRNKSHAFSDTASSSGSTGRTSSGQFADPRGSGGVFDISGDFLNDGLQNLSNRGSSASLGGHSPHRGSGRMSNGRLNSTGSASSEGTGRGTFSGGRDSIISTLAQRLTLSNLLTRKPAPDNTTRESFG